MKVAQKHIAEANIDYQREEPDYTLLHAWTQIWSGPCADPNCRKNHDTALVLAIAQVEDQMPYCHLKLSHRGGGEVAAALTKQHIAELIADLRAALDIMP